MSVHLQSNFGMGSDFGHADYVQAVNAGATLAEIKDWATRNANQFIGENAVGAGGLYDHIIEGMTPRGTRPPDNNPSNTAAGNWIGNSNTFDPNAKNYSIHRDIDVPEVNIPHPNDPFISSGGGSGNPANQYHHPMSSEFIRQTYDPPLAYENKGASNPGDNPYISSYQPTQFGYMNDPSTLSPEELAYRKGNIRGLDDRQNSVENAGALLDKYLFHIKDELKNQDELELKVGTITPQDTDLVRRDDELYGPYDQYSPERYY